MGSRGALAVRQGRRPAASQGRPDWWWSFPALCTRLGRFSMRLRRKTGAARPHVKHPGGLPSSAWPPPAKNGVARREDHCLHEQLLKTRWERSALGEPGHFGIAGQLELPGSSERLVRVTRRTSTYPRVPPRSRCVSRRVTTLRNSARPVRRPLRSARFGAVG